MSTIIIPAEVNVSDLFDFEVWAESVGLVKAQDEQPSKKEPGSFRPGKTQRDRESGAKAKHGLNRALRRDLNKAHALGDAKDEERALARLAEEGLLGKPYVHKKGSKGRG